MWEQKTLGVRQVSCSDGYRGTSCICAFTEPVVTDFTFDLSTCGLLGLSSAPFTKPQANQIVWAIVFLFNRLLRKY